VPDALRASLARLVGGRPEEVALTTGAGAGLAALAHGLAWREGDEIVTAAGEFPVQFTTWSPLAERLDLRLKVVQPAAAFLTAHDLISALTPRTRLVSVSLVRFDDGSLIDAATLAAACHARGTLLCLDVSQACGGMPLDVAQLGADFMICAGYKWLLSPYGSGFFWCRHDHLRTMRPGPFNWTSVEGADDFSVLGFSNPEPAESARRWDASEWAGAYNLNLMAMAASVPFIERLGPATVKAHNDRLIERMFAGLPVAAVTPASPLDPAARGPYGCIRASSPDQTRALFEALKEARVIVSLRQGNIRVSPHLFNTEDDIDRLLAVVNSRYIGLI
jgi:selenocysteine lyase/cysteine desulfurase